MSKRRIHTRSKATLSPTNLMKGIEWQSWLRNIVAAFIALAISRYFPDLPLPGLPSPVPPSPGHPVPEKPDTPQPPSIKADPVGAIVKVRHGNSFCTGVHLGDILKSGHSYFMTASHCTGGVGSSIEVELTTKQRINCMIVKRDTNADISICRAAMKADYPFAIISKTIPSKGEIVWHKGWGVNKPGNVEKGTVYQTPDNSKQTEFRILFSSGDSGAPIYLESTGEIIGVVCCTSGPRSFGGHGPAAWSLIEQIRSQEHIEEGPMPIPDCGIDKPGGIWDNS